MNLDMRSKAMLLVSLFFVSLMVPLAPATSAQEPQDAALDADALHPEVHQGTEALKS